MALLVRVTDSASFVFAGDPDADPSLRPPWWPADDQWLPAAGQPEGATRVQVRAMTQHERAAVAAVWDTVTPDGPPAAIDEAAGEAVRLLWACVLSVGGATVGHEEVDPGLKVAITRLVSRVTSGAYGPLGRC